MLAVHRDQLSLRLPGGFDDQLAARDEHFFVRQTYALSPPHRLVGRLETRDSYDCGQDKIDLGRGSRLYAGRWAGGEFGPFRTRELGADFFNGCVVYSDNHCRTKLSHLPGEQFGISAGDKGEYPELVRPAADHIERTYADGTGRAEQRDIRHKSQC